MSDNEAASSSRSSTTTSGNREVDTLNQKYAQMLAPPMLNDRNYIAWKFKMQNALQMQQVRYVLEEEFPAKESPNYDKFDRDNCTALYILCNSLHIAVLYSKHTVVQ